MLWMVRALAWESFLLQTEHRKCLAFWWRRRSFSSCCLFCVKVDYHSDVFLGCEEYTNESKLYKGIKFWISYVEFTIAIETPKLLLFNLFSFANHCVLFSRQYAVWAIFLDLDGVLINTQIFIWRDQWLSVQLKSNCFWCRCVFFTARRRL